jgi:hypothetical protein
VFVVIQSHKHLLSVQLRGRGDVDDVNVWVIAERFGVGTYRGFVITAESLENIGPNVGNSRKRELRMSAYRRYKGAAYTPEPDDSEAQRAGSA